MTDRVPIRIGLPLPLDIANTINSLIGRAYPSATIQMGSMDQLVLVVDPDDRREITDEEIVEAKVLLDGPEGILESVEDGGFSFSTVGEAGLALAEICKSMLDGGEVTAENYVEIQVEDKDTGERYVVVACRSAYQTPHTLRMAAESMKDAAVETLRQAHLHHEKQMEGHGRYIAQTIMAACSSAHAQPCAPCQTAAHIAETIPSKETA